MLEMAGGLCPKTVGSITGSLLVTVRRVASSGSRLMDEIIISFQVCVPGLSVQLCGAWHYVEGFDMRGAVIE